MSGLKNLMVSISGVRGIIGESLSPQVIIKYVQAFAEVIDGTKIVIGHDSRVSHQVLKTIAISCLQMMGKKVIDIGLVATPTVQMMVKELGADAGLIITASHNPIEWNGLKFVQSDSLFFSPDKFHRLKEAAEQSRFSLSAWEDLGTHEFFTLANQIHVEKILNLSFVKSDIIKQRRFKIVLDPINGAGSDIMQALLTQFGCTVLVINGESHGRFAHKPEPLDENLSELKQTVIKNGADLGIAVDPDCDRCVLIDQFGNSIGEEYTLAIAVKHVLSHKLGPVVKNLSSSQAINDIARYYNCPCYETEVGEINVAIKMQEVSAVIGGEGNGGVMLPDLHIGRDAPLAAALVLSYLAETNSTLNSAKSSLPQYVIQKDKITVDSIDFALIKNHFQAKFSQFKTNETDGLKFYHNDWWLHLRKSNTEPIIRIICETKSAVETQVLMDTIKKELSELSRS